MAEKNLLQSIRDFQRRMGEAPAGKAWDVVRESLADAITDIRQKVVEEPWFGRAVTPELVKEVDPPSGGIHGSPGGVHGPLEPGGNVHGPTNTGPRNDPPPTTPERSPVYREKVEELYEPGNRPGQSFTEAVAERYGWGKDFWPAKKEIAEQNPKKEPEHGADR